MTTSECLRSEGLSLPGFEKLATCAVREVRKRVRPLAVDQRGKRASTMAAAGCWREPSDLIPVG